MFDSFLKSKFYSKCKTAIKVTKTRIEMIKRKRNAMEKFLKKDIADLLMNGLDINAYGRAEGILIELNMSACYNFVGEFCLRLSKQVSAMDKQRDCPRECNEAVSSLMYAAARFADLPELRDLRTIFLEKYGNTIEANVNQEFVTRLKATPPTKEMKIQLLQDLALESGKNWDSKALEQKLYVPPSPEDGFSENTNGVNNTLLKSREELVNRYNKKDNENKRRNLSVPSSPRKLNDLPSYRTIKTKVDKHNLQEHKNNTVHPEDSEKVRTSFEKHEPKRTESEEKRPFQSKFSPPPPYHKRSTSELKHEKTVIENRYIQGKISGENGNQGENDEIKYYQKKFAPVSYRRRKFSWDQDEDLADENSEKTSGKDIKNKTNPEINGLEGKSVEKQHSQSKFAPPALYTGTKAETSLVEEKTKSDDTEKAKPKPKSVRSVRSRRSMVPPDEADIVKNEDILNAVRQELATKPGYKSKNINEDETDINEVFKRDSPRSGKGYRPDTKSIYPKLPSYDDFVTRFAYLRKD